MKKALFFALLFSVFFSKAQQQIPNKDIKNTIISFLKWHKSGGDFELGKAYFVPRFDGTDSIKTYFDTDSLELFYNRFRKSKFVSEEYIHLLKGYFKYYGQFIGPKKEPGEIVKIDGLDKDIVLNTYEPEVILDYLDKATITKSLILYNKALLSVNFSKGASLIFILTKHEERWLIDYLGPDNTSIKSFFRQ